MSTRMLQILGIAVLLLLVGGLVFFFFFRTSGPQPEENPGEVTFPGSENGGSDVPKSFTIFLSDGSERTVPNFTLENQPEVASPENGFQVAGDASTGDFQILYFPSESYFLVSLFVEPLGQTRREAEAALREKLGLSDADLCALHSDVTTSADVNEMYAGRNLGLSFCPGSVALP